MMILKLSSIVHPAAMVFNIIIVSTGTNLLHSDSSEPGTPTMNPEETSETSSSFEDDLTPKKKPQFQDIKF